MTKVLKVNKFQLIDSLILINCFLFHKIWTNLEALGKLAFLKPSYQLEGNRFMEVCMASGVCAAGGAAATVAGGFFLGAAQDVAVKIYYKSREVLDRAFLANALPGSEDHRFYAERMRHFREKGERIQLTTDRVVKAVVLGGVFSAVCYAATQYL